MPPALDEFADGVVVDCPKRVAGRRVSWSASITPSLWLPGMSIRGPLNSLTSSRKIATFHRARLGIRFVVLPGAVVLVPLPDVRVESHFAVDLELVHVQFFAEELHDGLDMRGGARASRKG